MHGFALTVLLDKPFRMFTAKRSKRKALEAINTFDHNKLWNKYEDLSYRERIEAGIFKAYLRVVESEKRKKNK